MVLHCLFKCLYIYIYTTKHKLKTVFKHFEVQIHFLLYIQYNYKLITLNF